MREAFPLEELLASLSTHAVITQLPGSDGAFILIDTFEEPPPLPLGGPPPLPPLDRDGARGGGARSPRGEGRSGRHHVGSRGGNSEGGGERGAVMAELRAVSSVALGGGGGAVLRDEDVIDDDGDDDDDDDPYYVTEEGYDDDEAAAAAAESFFPAAGVMSSLEVGDEDLSLIHI